MTDIETTARLLVQFSRNEDKYTFPRYWKYQQVSRAQGYYVRMPAETRKMFSFDGKPVDSSECGFQYFPYSCCRYAFSVNDERTVDEAAEIAMQHRVRMGREKVLDESAWGERSVKLSDLVEGDWAQGSECLPTLKNLIYAMLIKIQCDSCGIITPTESGDWNLVISPRDAFWLSMSNEMRCDVYRSTPNVVTREFVGDKYYLPAKYVGVHLQVEEKLPPGKVVFAMKDKRGTKEGALNFSTLTMFTHTDEMTLDRDRIICDVDMRVTCPMSGFLVDITGKQKVTDELVADAPIML